MKTLIAGILGGLIAFIWSAAVHMAPTGHMGLTYLEKEEPVINALKANVSKPGLYFFPGIDMTKEITKAEEEAWTAKYKQGPVGLLLYHPEGTEPMSPKQLLVEFGATAICGIIAAFILGSTVGSTARRAGLVALMGLFGWLAISVSYLNWYRFPDGFILLDLIDQVPGWLLAGFLIAKMVKPPIPTAS